MISACYCVTTWFGLLIHTVKHTVGHYSLQMNSYLPKAPEKGASNLYNQKKIKYVCLQHLYYTTL